MKRDNTTIETLMAQVYDRLQSLDDDAENAEAKRLFVFHMKDWIDDLDDFIQLLQDPERQKDKEQVAQTVAGFLYHAIPHLNAAGRLLLDHIPDPFIEDGRG